MTDLANRNYFGRKHKLPSLEPPRAKKRVRLDVMLSSLSLDGSKGVSTPVYINPLAVPEKNYKKQKDSDIDAIISGKIFESYKNDLLRGLQVIRYIHPVTVLQWSMQKWIKRLFNVFIRKYNRHNPGVQPMKTFRNYSQIMALVEDPSVNFSIGELLHIVVQESGLEMAAIARKRERIADSARLEEIKEHEHVAKECNYKYWDRLRTRPVDVDMEMDPSPGYDSAADMEVDEKLEANYYSQNM